MLMGASVDLFVEGAFALLGKSYKEMDCQEFVEEAMKAAGIYINKAGSNTWYRSMTWTGTPGECIAKFGYIPKGAILFIVEYNGKEPEKYRKDGKGNASHMGIRTGQGLGAIHSSESKGGVFESTFKDKAINGGWNRVGLLDLFDYGDVINKYLKKGEESPMSEKTATVVAENGKAVNFRSGTSIKSALIDRLDIGTKVVLIADYGEWCKVSVNGKTGYIMSNYLNYNGLPDDTIDDPAWASDVRKARDILDNVLKGV